MSGSDKSNAKKLDDAARLLVVELVIAGRRNSEIVRALNDAGYPSVTRQAIQRYRNMPGVRQAIIERFEATCQEGLGQRAVRLDVLCRMVEDVLADLYWHRRDALRSAMRATGSHEDVFQEALSAQVLSWVGRGLPPGRTADKLRHIEAIRRLCVLIGRLAGDDTPVRNVAVATASGDGAVALAVNVNGEGLCGEGSALLVDALRRMAASTGTAPGPDHSEPGAVDTGDDDHSRRISTIDFATNPVVCLASPSKNPQK